ncbi:non-ribosomal peptide synthetase [Hyphomonas oceanitis]|uniref:Amino acid adenylation protein n=1 Tax=Hyphomonas oceanitis SCH89 TaxID=1280953 RepID=A0A059G4Q7_9PROT|nr:non-ribosomal peptide synthetase [Hyphomonas oceanitis]KDA01438.1 amino acid adenylation protein [Hyphomonas oceanitis SCH89]
MNASDLLSQLGAAGIEVRRRKDKLVVNAPAGTLTADLRDKITVLKAELLDLLKDSNDGDVPLSRLPRDVPLPLSHFQERMWLLQQLDPDQTDYNLVTVWPMGPEVPPDRLVDAMREVVARHEILHLGFRRLSDMLVATPFNPEVVPISVEDISALSHDAQRSRIDGEIKHQVARPFVLDAEPPVRAVIFDLGEDGTALLIAAHHIAVDHWSLSLLRDELSSVLDGIPGPKYSDTYQYADYAGWARVVDGTLSMVEGVDWWGRYLNSPPDLCAFDADISSDVRSSGGSVSFVWDESLTADINRFARSESASVYMCLVAACAALLYRQTGQADILIGSAVGARQRPEFETIIGPFVNSITLRLEAGPSVTFRQLLTQAREAVIETSARADIPFESVIKRVQPVRNVNRSPLFQTAVVMQNAGSGHAEAIHGGGAIHDFTWFIRPLENQLVGSIEYRADIYSEKAIRDILGRLEAFVRSALAAPDQFIGEVPIFAPGERKRLIEEFNPTACAYDRSLIVDQVERVAHHMPSRPALSCAGITTSYGELDARANQIAHRLIQLGIKRGAIVGVCTDRSPALLEAILGVQKAGAAYLPLDPDFPSERLKYQLLDSGAIALISDAAFASTLALPADVAVLDINTEREGLAILPATRPARASSPEDISHLIYTSGSTGRPKGVIIQHKAVSNLVAAIRNEPGILQEDIVAATTTASFDIAAIELLVPLTVGARIELLSRAVVTDGLALADALNACKATVVQATPSAWRMLVEANWQGGEHITAITGGEPLTRDLADKLLDRVGKLYNGYGPTETTVYSSGCFVEQGGAAISIGKPIANTRIYVVDANGKLAPIGMRGEICIAGEGVAVGYHAMPEETELRFRPDEFCDNPAPYETVPRYYRTGDIGKWSAEGVLYHLGRMDHQVKIRGLRIELGEIEATLLSDPAIRQAVVIVSEAGQHDLRLVAYVVFEPGQERTASETRQLARERLPNYMVPSIIIDLMALPMTPNGKIDRKALPDPYSRSMQHVVRVPTEPGLESDFAKIWADVLQIENIGAEDNFFDLGGHSLLTLRVVSRVEEQLGMKLDPRLLFFQNLRQVAAQIRRTVEEQA